VLSPAKGIVKNTTDAILNPLRCIQGNSMPQYEREQANIIQAMKMIRMFMRVDHGVGDSDLLAKKLCSQIGRRVDQ
jgi:hypothetical protein